MRRYAPADYVVMPWKNGGGKTTELARDRDDADYGWRLSIADIGTDGPFSAFPDMRRITTVIEGAGMRLATDRIPSGDLRAFDPHAFDGGGRTTCNLINGPVRNLSLIYRAERYAARLEWTQSRRRAITDASKTLVFAAGEGISVGFDREAPFTMGAGELVRVDSSRPLSLIVDSTAGSQCAVVELYAAR